MTTKTNWKDLGIFKITSFSPKVHLGNPNRNVDEMIKLLEKMPEDSSLAVFPELGITGYSCEDYFLQSKLYQDIDVALESLLTFSKKKKYAIVVGLPVKTDNQCIYNSSLVIFNGEILGSVPKSYLPNYNEFYEKRWFTKGSFVNENITIAKRNIPLSRNQLFNINGVNIAIEICEDMWVPKPPAIEHSFAGADIILNLSASPEIVNKSNKRKKILESFSEKNLVGYVYVSSNYFESTKDVVYSGHMFAYECGSLLNEAKALSKIEEISFEFDVDRIRTEKMTNQSYRDLESERSQYSKHNVSFNKEISKIERSYKKYPFVPSDKNKLFERAEEIFKIQVFGLKRRMLSAKTKKLCIGFSGGLDSTWALLVANEAMKELGYDTKNLKAFSLPGLGTSKKTKSNIKKLVNNLDIDFKEIPIIKGAKQEFKDIEHDENDLNIVYENVQARERTKKLFNLANKEGALLVGTGDLSEIALGWCTYNGDHMSSYNVNASVPKTLIKYLVSYYAETHPNCKEALTDILGTDISPELLPTNGDKISQKTEDILGPYEVHDFILYHHIRYKFSLDKIYHLLVKEFSEFESKDLDNWVNIFKKRFYQNQFKRDCVPAGPKIGSVSLSPRGDFRLASEMDIFS